MSRTDRELLEKAARAAGITNLKYVHGAWHYFDEWGSGRVIAWNPLTDDGDALRLAVKLGLSVVQQATFAGPTPVSAACGFGDVEDFRLTSTDYNGDPYAATRRAIVRAAAEIGAAL